MRAMLHVGLGCLSLGNLNNLTDPPSIVGSLNNP
jgi:hypothetical protein